MTIMTLVAGLLAFIWGIIWALVLQFSRWGRFIARRRTWLAVVVGVGVDLVVIALLLDLDAWLNVLIIFIASAIPIVARSLVNEFGETEQALEAVDRGN